MIDRLKIDSLDLLPKLILAFVLVAALVAVTGAIGYTSVSAVDTEAHEIADDGQKMGAAAELVVALERQQKAIQSAQLGEPNAQQEFESANEEFAQWSGQLRDSHLSAGQSTALDDIRRWHEEYNAVAAEFFEASADGNAGLADRRAEEMQMLTNDMAGAANTIEESARTDLEAQVAAADATTSRAQLEILGLTGGAFVVAIAIGLFVARRITAPVSQLSEAAVAASEGDLQTDLDDHPESDELGRMVAAFREMQTNLRGVFGELSAVSRDLEAGTPERDVETDYPGTYGDVLGGLDAGTTQLTESFEQIERASDGLEAGDFDQSFDADRPGRYGAVLDGLATGTDQLAASFDEISSASRGLTTGRLDQEIHTDQPGQYGAVLGDLADGTDQLSRSFEGIRHASEGLETGDLDRHLDTEAPGEYGAVLTALEEGLEQLNDSLRTVEGIATEVATSSEEAASSSEEIEQAAGEVADSVEEIAHGAETQSENLQEVAGEMNDMSATVEEVAASAGEVAETAATAVERSEAGQAYAAEATDEMASIESEAAEAATQVETLDDHVDEIGEIVELITDIADQTNMLALNASIEAARAGEAGEGFAVVADEIKGLAAEVGDATTDIEQRISTIQSTTGETVDSMERMRERVERGAETIDEAIRMFDEIADAVDEAEAGIQEISDATDDQAASSEEVVAMVDQVSSVSQQTAAEASNVSAATEEQSASLSEVSENVQFLSRLSEDLRGQVASFDLREDATVDDDVAAAGAEGTTGPAAADGGRRASDGN